jgi:hypothetical protein
MRMSRTDLTTALTNFQEKQKKDYIYRHAILEITDLKNLWMVYKLSI